jgi:hypothetical protein
VAINDSNNGIVDARFMVISLPVCLIQGITGLLVMEKHVLKLEKPYLMALIIRQLDVTGHGNGSAMRSAPIGIIFQKLQMQI